MSEVLRRITRILRAGVRACPRCRDVARAGCSSCAGSGVVFEA